jgi:hypothetical protein
MPTFKRRNAVVDARQFDGTRTCGLALVFWINAHQNGAMWADDISSLNMNVAGRLTKVHKDYWVILNQDGTFDRMSPEDFAEEFEQV